MRVWTPRAAAALLGTLSACSAGEPDPPAPSVSVLEVMVDGIAPASQAIWNAAAEEYAPQSSDQWQSLAARGDQIAEAGAQIALGGTGPLDAQWAADPGWRALAEQMGDAGRAAAAAARRQDLDAVLAAGDPLIESCEGCHQAYKPVPQPE